MMLPSFDMLPPGHVPTGLLDWRQTTGVSGSSCKHFATGPQLQQSRAVDWAIATHAAKKEPPERRWPRGWFPQADLHVVVEREFVRVRPDLDRQDLVFALEVDPRLDEVGRENAALGEVFVVFFQPVDHRGELRGRLRDVGGLFGWELVE